MNTSVSQRWRDRVGSYRPAGEVIKTSRYEVAAITDDRTAKAFVCAHHYSASYPAARFRFGLFCGQQLAGVAVFSHPTNPLALRPLTGDVLAGTELGRFVLVDDVPGNGETWFLARAFELLRREGIRGVVSFSDPCPRISETGAIVFAGHIGTIYQAHNAVYLGRARSDFLRLLPDGRVLHNRALAKARKGERGWRYVVDALVSFGAPPPANDVASWVEEWVPRLTRKVKHAGNHKYAWALDTRSRRALPLSLPYPKFDAAPRGAA